MTNGSGPTSVGIIMDGNRRWAKEHGLPQLEGHRRGAEKLKDVLAWGEQEGIRCFVVYAFSTENWKRDKSEVAGLLSLFGEYLGKEMDELAERATVRFIGDRTRIPAELCYRMQAVEESSNGEGKPVVAFALSYGGRNEITHAVNTLLSRGVDHVTEEDISGALYTSGLPDPDLIIRTGGERRLSNFLPWQSTYSELVFTDTLWPDVSQEEFRLHIAAFRHSKRNFGV